MNKKHEKILIRNKRKQLIKGNKRRYIVDATEWLKLFNDPITYDRIIIDPR